MKYILFILTLSLSLITAAEPKKKALIFGITGQDGAYLTKLLLDKDYEVYGVKRRAANTNTQKLEAIFENTKYSLNDVILHYGDLSDACSIFEIVKNIQPDEIYNLAAQSNVRDSFDNPEYTSNINALGTLRILEAVRQLKLENKTRFYQASTSELFGKVEKTPQDESTNFNPRSPYGVAKLFAYWIVKNYREAYGMFACNGILFNHESPLRGETFVTKKITLAASKIARNLQDVLYLGNLDAQRDWGFAGDYVEAMWKMMQQDKAEDYVVSSGETHTVREFVEKSFIEAGIPIAWRGKGVDEVGVNKKTGKVVVKIDPIHFRPTEVDLLLGNAFKASDKLNWKPKTSFSELVKMMMKSDLE
jgi:GDPmannose 4,6-dehydratase